MLVIRQEQIDALIKGTDDEWIEFLAGHARQEFPEATAELDDETLRRRVRGGVRRAESHGFKTAEDQTAFISIMFEIAPNFDEQPAIKAVLDDDKFSPADRLERLWSPLVTDEDWEKAADDYDESAWDKYAEQETADRQ